jgi:hypothetical protein
MQMSRNKELQNQLRIALVHTDFSQHGLDDFTKLYRCLTDEFSSKTGTSTFMNRGRVDREFTMGAMLEDLKRLFVSLKDPEDFTKALDIQEMIMKHDPLNDDLHFIPHKTYCENLVDLCRFKDVALNDLVRQSTLNLKVNVQRLGFLFPEMVGHHKQNFVDHVAPEVLNAFCNQLVYRGSQDKFVFDHLAHASTSTFHRGVQPFNEYTFHLIRRITKDFMQKAD